MLSEEDRHRVDLLLFNMQSIRQSLIDRVGVPLSGDMVIWIDRSTVDAAEAELRAAAAPHYPDMPTYEVEKWF